MTFALPGDDGDYAVQIDAPAFVHQELIEILYHTLWETVHVFFEHRELGLDTGPAGFLYPFLGSEGQHSEALVADVARSIVAKASDVERLREEVGRTEGRAHRRRRSPRSNDRLQQRRQADSVRQRRLGDRCQRLGHRLRGAAATAIGPIPAISLSHEPATITAIANDVGNDLIFLRQLIAHAQPQDVGDRHLDQRRIEERRRRARGGAKARPA